MIWVRKMGSVKHSIFRTANNKFLPILYVINNKPGVWAYTTMWKIVNALPLIKLLHVVIVINPGVYMKKVDMPPRKALIEFQGMGADKILIQSGDNVGTSWSNGHLMGIYFSAMVVVNSLYFISKKLTLQECNPKKSVGISTSHYCIMQKRWWLWLYHLDHNLIKKSWTPIGPLFVICCEDVLFLTKLSQPELFSIQICNDQLEGPMIMISKNDHWFFPRPV